MDKIFLNGMKVDTLIGVYDWERTRLQTLVLDLTIGLPERAAYDDKIEHTIHYGEVCQRVREALQQGDFQLLESLAEFVATLIVDEFQAAFVRVKVVKPGILPNVREVGVEIERSRAVNIKEV